MSEYIIWKQDDNAFTYDDKDEEFRFYFNGDLLVRLSRNNDSGAIRLKDWGGVYTDRDLYLYVGTDMPSTLGVVNPTMSPYPLFSVDPLGNTMAKQLKATTSEAGMKMVSAAWGFDSGCSRVRTYVNREEINAGDLTEYWVTINALYEEDDDGFSKDDIAQPATAFRLTMDSAIILFKSGGTVQWSKEDWDRRLHLDLNSAYAGIWKPNFPGEEGYCFVEGVNPKSFTSYVRGRHAVNFKAMYDTAPSSITLSEVRSYNWDNNPEIKDVDTTGFTLYGISDNNVPSTGFAYRIMKYHLT